MTSPPPGGEPPRGRGTAWALLWVAAVLGVEWTVSAGFGWAWLAGRFEVVRAGTAALRAYFTGG